MKTTLKNKMLVSLEEALRKWVEEQCNGDEWIQNIWGDKSTHLMAVAAMSVLEAIDECQEYALKEGYYKYED